MTAHPTPEWVKVTPAMAEEWLGKNKVNRKISDQHVYRLALDMEAGNWRRTHQGLAFDTRDNCLDGQHRLSAVVLSGKTIEFLVTRGLPPSSMAVMDVDVRRRSLANVLEIDGGAKKWGVPAQTIQTVAAAMFRGPHDRRAQSTQILRDFANNYVDNIAWACAQFTTPGRGVAKSAVVAAVARAHYCGKNKGWLTDISEFAKVLNLGLTDGSEKQAAIIKLRDLMMRTDARGSGNAFGVETYRRTAAALDAYLRGKKTGQFSAFKLPEDAGAEELSAEGGD